MNALVLERSCLLSSPTACVVVNHFTETLVTVQIVNKTFTIAGS